MIPVISRIDARCLAIPAISSAAVPLSTLCPAASSLRRSSRSRQTSATSAAMRYAQRLRHILAAVDAGEAIDFQFRVAEFADRLEVGLRRRAHGVGDGKKARLACLHRGRGRRQRRQQRLDPAFTEIGLGLRCVAIADEVHLQIVSFQKCRKHIARQARTRRPRHTCRDWTAGHRSVPECFRSTNHC